MSQVALYTRVSTEDQAREGYSLETQREFLEKYAHQQGWNIYSPEPNHIYEDDGVSGATMRRPALQRLLRDAKAKKFDTVLVYKLDRLNRNLKDLLNLVDMLESWGVGFRSATENFDTTTSAGKMAFQQMGSVAEFFRNQLAERVFPGMVKCVQEGKWHGARYSPYGYRYNKEKELLEVAPEEVKIVKLIYTMYLSGQSTLQIAGYLYQKGYRTRSGGRFHTKLVGDILKNPIYIGKLVWNKKHYDKRQKTPRGYKAVKNPVEQQVVAQGKHKPIIPEDDFHRVQERLAMNRKGSLQRANAKEYPLSGVVFCAKCGHKYQGGLCITNHRTNEKKRWYRCAALGQHNIHCSNPAIRAEVLEPQVFVILELLLRHPTVKTGRIGLLIQSHAQLNDEQLEQQRQELKTKLKTNLEKQGKLTDAYLEGTVAKEVYKERCELVREEESQLRQNISKVEMQVIEKERSAEYRKLLETLVADFDGTVEQLDIFKKKQILRLIFKRVEVADGHITDRQLYEPFQTMYNEMLAKTNTKEDKELADLCERVCISLPTGVR